MAITRRNALVGLAASFGATAPIPAFVAPVAAPAFVSAAGPPISLSDYNTYYRKKPVWADDFAAPDFMPLVHAHRWHFDGSTYDEPLIGCVTNGRVFKVHRSRNYGTMVFEFWLLDLVKYGAPDVGAEELAGAACYAAAWACKFSTYELEKGWSTALVDGHKGAVFIEFSAADLTSPAVTDAPPLIIHDQLTPARPWTIEEEEADDEDDELEREDPA